jgi:hypothetical protein
MSSAATRIWRQNTSCNQRVYTHNHQHSLLLLLLRPPLLLLLLLLLFALQAEADDEPLALSGVDIDAAAVQQLTAAWQAGRRSSLYPSAQHFLQLVQQVSHGIMPRLC